MPLKLLQGEGLRRWGVGVGQDALQRRPGEEEVHHLGDDRDRRQIGIEFGAEAFLLLPEPDQGGEAGEDPSQNLSKDGAHDGALVIQEFPDHEPEKIRVFGEPGGLMGHEPGDRFLGRGVAETGGTLCGKALDEASEAGAVEAFLVLEVVVEEGGVGAGPAPDGLYRCACKSLTGKEMLSGVEDGIAG